VPARHRRIDLEARARDDGVELGPALERLRDLYRDIDGRNARNTAGLGLPCERGCDGCCHDSVLLTPLEFYGAWDLLQRSYDDDTVDYVVEEGLQLYAQHKALIDALDAPPPPGEVDHTSLTASLRFRCPLLGKGGACLVYPMREALARLFGSSFNDDGGVYGCHLVGHHLGGKLVQLVRARPMAMRVHDLPLTHKQQVYPHYIHALYSAS
jgi:Fe-S-cluster containining protein